MLSVFILIIFGYFYVYKAIKKRKALIAADEIETQKMNSTIKIIFGIIFFIAGLVSLISRGEITVKIVGREQMMKEAFFGWSSTSDTLMTIIIISAVVMIIGLALTIWGFMQAQKKN